MLPKSRRRVLGVTLIEVLAVTSLMQGLQSQGNFQYAINKANELKGLNNLRQIYLLLQVQCISGGLPDAAFYPKGDPRKDPKSILRLIPSAPKELFVSPFAPPALQETGLTYAWNSALNGKSLDQVPKDAWLLMDVAAFIADPKLPKPGKYLVLYADGRAAAVSELPEDILKVVKEAEAKRSGPEPEKEAPKAKVLPKAKSSLPKVPLQRLPGGQAVPVPPSLPRM